jgi:hypothetical protein
MAGPTPRSDAPDPAALRKPWQALVLTRAQELRLILAEKVADPVQHAAIERHLDDAEQAATEFRRRFVRRRPPRETAVERAFGELDAAEASLLRGTPDAYVLGQLPSIVAQVRSHLPRGDERLERLMAIEQRHRAAPATGMSEEDRTAMITAFRASALESRRELARVHNLSVLLYGIALALTLGAVALGAVGLAFKTAIPLCFTPDDAAVVCPARAESAGLTTAAGDAPPARDETKVTDAIESVTSRGDVVLVELLGLVAAGVAAAAALRRLEGTSTPFNLPCAAAVLKLPTGALTAVLGLVLMRGDFVPGLSALDNSAQILAWAVIFGYSQELFTRFADARAQTVLGKVGTPGDQKQPDGTTVPSVTGG